MRVAYGVNAAQYGDRYIIYEDENTAVAFVMRFYGVGESSAKAYVHRVPYITEKTCESEIKKIDEEGDDD